MDTIKTVDEASRDLAARLAEQGVEFVLGAWVDVLGRAKSKVVPVGHVDKMLAGSERYTPRGMGDLGQMNATEDECVAVPDPSTLTVLPWDRRVAMMNADLLFGGRTPWENCPRSILKSVLSRAEHLGYRFNLGVETEFYVYRRDSLPELVPLAAVPRMHPTPCYDVETALDSLDFLGRVSAYMSECGLSLFSLDQEGGDGQYELDFSHDECLSACDRLTLLRLLLRQVAKEVDAVVTFMPKPARGVWGSGAHMNMSLESIETGENLFRSSAGDGGDGGGHAWTKLAMSFVAGVLRHARALAALTTPTVNSYKRLVGSLADGSISWAPVWAAWGENNRSCMIRVPGNRPAVENRAVDISANAYLASAFTLAAGLEGIELGLDPGPPAREATYTWDARVRSVDGRERLPRTLLEAIEAFADDPLVHEVFSPGFVADYTDMKHREWEDYAAEVTPWEVDRYLTNL
jgi:glutamine synthetase